MDRYYCFSPRVLPGSITSAQTCRTCSLADHPFRVGDRPQKSAVCRHLGEPTGERVLCPPCGAGVKLKTFDCAVHGTCTLQKRVDGSACCKGCGDFTPGRPLSVFVHKPFDPACGVVIGSYNLPGTVELNINLIRHTCGPVPILISDDCSDGSGPVAKDGSKYARLESLCKKYAAVTMWPNVERIGHAGGDMGAYWKGLQWAKSNGITVLAKLSQRFIITKPRWLHDGAIELLASGKPFAGQPCPQHNFPLRSEAALLDVAKCATQEVLLSLTPRCLFAAESKWNPRADWCAETLSYKALALAGEMHPWGLFGDNRDVRSEGVLWHNSHSWWEYVKLFREFDVSLEGDAPVHEAGATWWGSMPGYQWG